VFYCGYYDWVVYECIFDVCGIIKLSGVIVDDVVKWLIDYGFYVLIMSFLVVGILMVELIESEDFGELDCFCDVMIVICEEICCVEVGEWILESLLLCGVLYMVVVVIIGIEECVYFVEFVVFLIGLDFDKYWFLVGCID